MRILIAVHGYPPTHYAGAERAAERIVRWLVSQNHEVDVFTIENPESPEQKVETSSENGVTIHRIFCDLNQGDHFRNLYDHSFIAEAAENLLRQTAFDLVHVVSGYLLGAQVIRAAHQARIPAVVTLTEYWFLCAQLNLLQTDGELCNGPESHTKCARCIAQNRRRHRYLERAAPHIMDTLWSGANRVPFVQSYVNQVKQRQTALREALNMADLVISPSRFLINKYGEFGFDTRRYVYIRHGLTAVKAPEAITSAKDSDTLRLGYIGQIKYHKGTDLLVSAVLPLLDAGHAISVDIWGPTHEDPEYAHQLQERTRDYPTIQWRGRYEAPRVWDILSGFDALVVPSRWYENSPTVIAEAFTVGLPVLATNLGGMAELIEHEKSGLLFELNNTVSLQQQIRRLLQEPDLLDNLRAGVPSVKTAEDEILEIFEQYARLTCRISEPTSQDYP